MIGVHSTAKNLRASLVALMTLCVTRAGVRLRVSSRNLPITRREVLPSGMNRPWAGSNRYKISELIAVHRRVATLGRFTLTTFLCTLQGTTSDGVPIRTLQHSILGTWLTLTQAGVSPASHQIISSPHVHAIVIWPVCVSSRYFGAGTDSGGVVASSNSMIATPFLSTPTMRPVGMSLGS